MYDDCFIEGNLRERSLKDIWEEPNSFLYNRNFSTDLLTGYCHTCEYGKMCAEVESAGGTVDDSGNIILPNGKQASIRTRKAGLFDKLKNIGSKIIDSVTSICKKLFGAENEIRKELSNCNEKMQAWSMAGQEVNESYEDKIQAINDCLKELQNIGN